MADNGSTDGSIELAQRAGARVVPVEERGYGNALMGGIAAARGEYVVMGDADMSYDFRDLRSWMANWKPGSIIAGAFADWTGNYRMGFTILALLAGLGSVFFLVARRPRRAA